jgi:hypothetical protein
MRSSPPHLGRAARAAPADGPGAAGVPPGWFRMATSSKRRLALLVRLLT